MPSAGSTQAVPPLPASPRPLLLAAGHGPPIAGYPSKTSCPRLSPGANLLKPRASAQGSAQQTLLEEIHHLSVPRPLWPALASGLEAPGPSGREVRQVVLPDPRTPLWPSPTPPLLARVIREPRPRGPGRKPTLVGSWFLFPVPTFRGNWGPQC